MIPRTLVSAVAMCVVLVVSMGAEPATNFAGKWTFVSGSSLSVGPKPVITEVVVPAGPLGPGGIITQDDKQFTVTPAATGAQKTICSLSDPTREDGQGLSDHCTGRVREKSLMLMGMERGTNGALMPWTAEFSFDIEGRLVIQLSGPAELGHPGPILKLIYRRSASAK